MNGKIALVTGSTSGIGLGIARRLAENGCHIVLTGLGHQKSIDEVVQEFESCFSVKVNFVPGDLRDLNSIIQLCERVTELYPDGIDILLNNAGIQHVAPIDEYPVEKWDEMMAITLTAPFYLIRHFLPYMKKKGWGRIINTASQMAVISALGKAPYSAAKAGLVGLTKGVALEVAEYGITCNAICPGFTDTQLLEEQVRELSKKMNIPFEEAKLAIHTAKADSIQTIVLLRAITNLRQLMKGDAGRPPNVRLVLLDVMNVDSFMPYWRATAAYILPSFNISRSFTISAIVIILCCRLGSAPALEEGSRLGTIAGVKIEAKFNKIHEKITHSTLYSKPLSVKT